MANILFVCTGNICRSPMAAGMLLAGLREAGHGNAHVIESAGIHAVVDAPPTVNALKVAATYGVDISAHRARTFDKIDFQRFEWIYALDSGHLDFLREIRPRDYGGELSLLPGPNGGRKLEIADPYGRSRRAYERSARLIAVGVGVILAGLLERASAARLPEISGRGR